MNYSKGDIILLPFPFTDLLTRKVRPAIVAGSDKGKYSDIFAVPLTSKIDKLADGEEPLINWKEAGLNVPTAIKKGCIFVSTDLILKKVGRSTKPDIIQLDNSLKIWLELD